MFWTRNSSANAATTINSQILTPTTTSTSTTNPNSSTSNQSSSQSTAINNHVSITNSSSTSSTRNNNKFENIILKNINRFNESNLSTNTNSNNQNQTAYRSNSLHYVTFDNNKPSSQSVILSSLQAFGSTNALSSTVNTSGMASSIASSTLKPFYNKLKKSHLFGVKLEKICGAYSLTNNQLPPQIMNLLEKVAGEGSQSLMIFRKSASAKLKKSYKDKLDSNQTIDYNEMNVHVAALLLKVCYYILNSLLVK